METAQLTELFLNITDKIGVYWNFYTVGIIAVIGWLISTKRHLTPTVRVLVSLGFILFALMNVLGLRNGYLFLEATRLELLEKVSAQTLPYLYPVLDTISYKSQLLFTYVIHLIMDVPLLIAIWYKSPVKD